MTSLVWFRQDLRLADNPAWSAAAKSGPVVAVFVLDEESTGVRKLGGASRWWLHHSLEALSASLNGRLVLRAGPAANVLPQLAKDAGATGVYWNRVFDEGGRKAETDVANALRVRGFEPHAFNGGLLHDPDVVRTGAGDPYKVFTPFWRALARQKMDASIAAPSRVAYAPEISSERLQSFKLTPEKPDWAKGWREIWTPGESGAQNRLRRFIETSLHGYSDTRNLPGVEGVSRLSPHLHWGEVSPRQIWTAVTASREHGAVSEAAAEAYLREIAWREFSHHLLFHFPNLPTRNWKHAFDAYPWQDNPAALRAWRKGQTGYPLVDAGMRELWATGYMHNRVRMVTASFLVKHLRIDWRKGEAWFWDTLVDADIAQNAASWQWVSGSGADAAPYFRIFNPTTQAEKFDPDGTYIRRWVPELSRLPTRFLLAPFDAPDAVLRAAGVTLGESYPKPIVDHDRARAAALAGLEAMKSRIA